MPKFLWYFIKNQWKYVLGFIVVAIIYNLIVISTSYFLSKTVWKLPYLLKDGDFWNYVFYLKILLVAEILNILFWIVHTVVYTRFRWYMNIFVRIFWVDRMIELDYSKLAKLWSWKLLQIVKNWIEAYTFLIFNWIDRLIEFLIRFMILFFILSYFDLKFAIVFIIWIWFIILIQKYIYKKLTDVREKERELNENYTKQTAKIFMNFILLKIANLKEKELSKLYQIWKHRVNNYVWLKFWFSAWARFVNLLMTVIFIFSLFYFWKLYLQGKVSFDLVLWISILFMFARRVLNRLAFFVSELAEKWTYIERFDSLVKKEEVRRESEEVWRDLLSEEREDQKKIWISLKSDYKELLDDIFENFENINFEDIWFRYEWQKLYLFEWFNFSFKNWEKIAILGRSGSWKSTLFKMLVRLIEPERGSIKIKARITDDFPVRWKISNRVNSEDDQMIDLKEIDPIIICQRIWYFYQEPLVFDWTIRENLTLWLANIDDEKLKQVLKIVELDHLSLDTIIGERWVLLSGWEKQRLALWRAFVFDYEILLLDEPTSNLDLYLEKKILDEIFKKYKNKTILVVSHRPYVLENVNRVVVMKKGEIVFDEIVTKEIIRKVEEMINQKSGEVRRD